MDYHTTPSFIMISFMSLPPMTSIKRFPQATPTTKRYPMAFFILQLVEKAVTPMRNAQYPALSYVFLALLFINHSKPNQPLQHIPHTPKFSPSIWPPKWYNGSNPSYETLDSMYLMLQLPYMSTANILLIL